MTRRVSHSTCNQDRRQVLFRVRALIIMIPFVHAHENIRRRALRKPPSLTLILHFFFLPSHSRFVFPSFQETTLNWNVNCILRLRLASDKSGSTDLSIWHNPDTLFEPTKARLFYYHKINEILRFDNDKNSLFSRTNSIFNSKLFPLIMKIVVSGQI